MQKSAPRSSIQSESGSNATKPGGVDMDDLDRPHVPVFGYSWVPGRRFAYLAEQRLIVVLMVDGINLGWMTTN
jgi:hypothetical protein